MVAKMTLEEKVGLSRHVLIIFSALYSCLFQANFTISIPVGEDMLTSCEGRIGPIERLDFPGMCLADAGNGLRYGEMTSSWPSGISVAAR